MEPPPLTVEADRPCLQCGYNLRGLAMSGQCPECGAPVERSLQGNLLKFSSPEYVALLHRGTFLVQAAIVVNVLLMVALFAVAGIVAYLASAGAVAGGWSGSDSERVLSILQSGASLVSLLGWWMLSAKDPAFVGAEDGSTARGVVRGAVAVQAAAALLVALVGRGNPQAVVAGAKLTPWAAAAIGAMVLSFIAWIVWYFAAMRYLRWLSPRLPSGRVHDRAKLLTWLGPVLWIFGCGIGQLVALVMYYNLLDWVRKDLRAIRAEQAAI